MHSVKKIAFNEVGFINRMGIKAMCPNQVAADAIYKHLMNNSQVKYGTKRFFFLDAIVNVARQRMKLSRHKIIKQMKYAFFWDFYDFLIYRVYKATNVIDLKFCGFFNVYSSDSNQYRLHSSGYAFIEGVNVSEKFHSNVLASTLFLDGESNVCLLNNALGFYDDSGNENYFFFLESEVMSIIERHYSDSVQEFKFIDADLYFQNGENITKTDRRIKPEESVELEHDTTKNLEGYSIEESELRSVSPNSFIATTELIFEFITELKINSFLVEDDIYEYFKKTYKNSPWTTAAKSFLESDERLHRSLSKHDAYMFITALILLLIALKDSKHFNQTRFFDKCEDYYTENIQYVGWRKDSIQKFFAPKKRLLQLMLKVEA